MQGKNINDQEFNGLKVDKIFKSEMCETLSIRLEANHTLPKHTTPKEALLLVHLGEIVFSINGEQFELKTGDTYQIPPNEEHSVVAKSNSIFLIVR
jgi:quercetin dioxygenase-like cupin family protein